MNELVTVNIYKIDLGIICFWELVVLIQLKLVGFSSFLIFRVQLQSDDVVEVELFFQEVCLDTVIRRVGFLDIIRFFKGLLMQNLMVSYNSGLERWLCQNQSWGGVF